ncbi:MAG: hypothetical protein ACI8TP_003922, partial [Acidimicrobiales bacterium]
MCGAFSLQHERGIALWDNGALIDHLGGGWCFLGLFFLGLFFLGLFFLGRSRFGAGFGDSSDVIGTTAVRAGGDGQGK